MRRHLYLVLSILLLLTALAIRLAYAAPSNESPVALEFLEPPTLDRAEFDATPKLVRTAKQRRLEPYVGWRSWCEPVVLTSCTRDSDCATVSTPERPQRCVRPRWARKGNAGDADKVCAAPWPSRREQDWRRARLEEIVSEICSGPGCNRRALSRFLGIVALRESTWRPWKAHRLNGDLRANREAWRRKAAAYQGNPHYGDRGRWQGYGEFGQNAALFVYLWDRQAPPEVLCREVESVATYVERARIALRKQRSLGITPTWATVHAALAQGEVRPSAGALERFRARAARAGLDANQPLDERDLGRRLGTDVLSRRLAAEILRARVDEEHPRPAVRL